MKFLVDSIYYRGHILDIFYDNKYYRGYIPDILTMPDFVWPVGGEKTPNDAMTQGKLCVDYDLDEYVE